MKKSEIFNYYNSCVSRLEDVYRNIRSGYGDTDAEDLCKLRGYFDDRMPDHLRSWGIGYVDNLIDIGENWADVGVFSKKGNFLLEGRYVIPIRGLNGDLLALVGYAPVDDGHKYVTTPFPFFSKDVLLFNYYNCIGEDVVFLVEGLFDVISLSLVGIPAVAVMGATLSGRQAELLRSFRKVVALPDADSMGRKAVHKWAIPSNTVMVKINDTTGRCKDMDNFVALYEEDSVRDILYGLSEEHGIVTLDL